ncbi:hypothetical protein F511_30287 [Dorcoceras hygrometricum]|uniref:Uncharacterized protein n=1 Tax=Dorcoceras hygrometricum TaxID=472368 RepID=A0A2Z7BYL2_9LAMI|nr:hypothetical protein F511_30287 [Dorcoceras hygrometricum]
MRTRSDKRPNRKNDRKVLVAEESNKNWADSDLDYTSSSSSSSDSDPKEVHCLMADQTTTEDELSQTFEEVKAENNSLKNSSVESSTAQLEDINSLKTELSKLMIENDLLRNMSCEIKSENERLNEVMSSWKKSFVSLSKLHETQKPQNDKSGLGFCVGESSSEGTSTQSDLAYEKFKTMNFVKASVIHNAYESVKYDDQTSGKLNPKGKAGIGYIRPENSKPSWLKNIFDKDKAKAGSKSSVPNKSRRGSKKVKSVWVKFQPQRDLNGRNTKPKLNRSHNISAHTLMDSHTGKTVKSTRSVLGKWVYLVTLTMSLFDLQDVCIAIGSLATLDLPMVVDLIGIYGLKGPYCTLTTTKWFLQALSVIPRGSWHDVARRFTMIRWASPKL